MNKPAYIPAIAVIATLFVLGVLPILPDQAIDPWGFFNPRKFTFLIFIIAMMQFIGYLSMRITGERYGRAFIGFFGGLVSSTAIYAIIPHLLGKHNRYFWATQITAILAITATLMEVCIITGMAASALFTRLQWPLITMIVITFMITMTLFRYEKPRQNEKVLVAPIDITGLLKTTIIIVLIFFILALTKKYYNTEGILITSFFAGLFELHGVTLSTALLYSENQLSLQHASDIIAVAILASFISKYILLWALTNRRFASIATLFNTIIWMSGGITYYLIYHG